MWTTPILLPYHIHLVVQHARKNIAPKTILMLQQAINISLTFEHDACCNKLNERIYLNALSRRKIRNDFKKDKPKSFKIE
jgi:hypothetical protein